MAGEDTGVVNVAPQATDVKPAEGATADTKAPVVEAPKPDEVQALRADMERLRAENDKKTGYLVALTQRLAQQTTREEDVDPDEQRAAVKDLLDKDPVAALNAHFQERVAPIVNQNLSTLAVINKERAIEKIGTDAWKKWGSKIEEFMAPFNPNTKAEPGAWENAYNFVRIQHVDEIIKDGVRKEMEAMQQTTQLEGASNGAGSPGKKTAPLSSLEKQIATEFGMTDDEWRKYENTGATGE
jgi:phage I-like protein